MNTTNGKLYEHFSGPERITLILEALARGDAAEADRLSGSCPRRTYTMRDAAYGDRMDAAFDIMAIACIDLRCLWGKLDLLRWTLAVNRRLSTHHQIVATMAFLDGSLHGQGRPQMEFFSGIRSEKEGDDDDDGDDDAPEPLSAVMEGELASRMAIVEGRAQEVTDWASMELSRAAAATARQLAEVWTAFDRFCHGRLGVPAATMLAAWQFPTGADVTEMLGQHTGVTPNPANVDEYYGIYCQAWDRKFGEAQ